MNWGIHPWSWWCWWSSSTWRYFMPPRLGDGWSSLSLRVPRMRNILLMDSRKARMSGDIEWNLSNAISNTTSTCLLLGPTHERLVSYFFWAAPLKQGLGHSPYTGHREQMQEFHHFIHSETTLFGRNLSLQFSWVMQPFDCCGPRQNHK